MTRKNAIKLLREQINETFSVEVAEAFCMAISALKKQEGKKLISVETNIYDQEEIHHGCTVQVLRNSVTGDVSVGWWKEKEEET